MSRVTFYFYFFFLLGRDDGWMGEKQTVFIRIRSSFLLLLLLRKCVSRHFQMFDELEENKNFIFYRKWNGNDQFIVIHHLTTPYPTNNKYYFIIIHPEGFYI